MHMYVHTYGEEEEEKRGKEEKGEKKRTRPSLVCLRRPYISWHDAPARRRHRRRASRSLVERAGSYTRTMGQVAGQNLCIFSAPNHAMPCHSRVTVMYVGCCVGTSRSIMDGAKKNPPGTLAAGNIGRRRASHMLASSLAHSRTASHFSLLLLFFVFFPAGLPAGRSPGPGYSRLLELQLGHWAHGRRGFDFAVATMDAFRRLPLPPLRPWTSIVPYLQRAVLVQYHSVR